MVTCCSAPSRRAPALQAIAQEIRAEIITILGGLGEERRGHPGPSLSVVDIVTALYFDILRINPADPHWANRDRFILSKGHGCLAVYVALARRGFFDPKHLTTFRSCGSILQGHPDMNRTPGIDMTSGSLGNGLGAGVGMALAVRSFASEPHVYVVMGDGEQQEGIVWEAAMTASKYKLANLTVFVDCNGFQSGGRVADIMPVEPLRAKWEAFGWNVLEIDGHDMQQILYAVEYAKGNIQKPTVILAQTVKGKGVAYMEGNNEWHQKAVTGPAVRHEKRLRPQHQKLSSMRVAYGQSLLELARARDDISIVTADAFGSMGLEAVRAEFPERCVDVGIAEQNLMMVAAGMATTGRMVFASVYAAFTIRACEQIRTFLAYPNLNVKIVAGLAGFSGGIEGVTHLATEDIGIMRSIPNVVILNPADAAATGKAIRAAAEHPGPVYIRLGRDPSPAIFGDEHPFAVGKAQILVAEGSDAALLTSGLIISDVIRAAAILKRLGIGCKVIDCPSIKPFDKDMVFSLAKQVHALFTIEEHNILGGLGSAVLEALAPTPCVPIERIGICDCFSESGTPEELRSKHELTAQQIAIRVRRCLSLRRLSAAPDQEEPNERLRKHDTQDETGPQLHNHKRETEKDDDLWDASRFRHP